MTERRRGAKRFKISHKQTEKNINVKTTVTGVDGDGKATNVTTAGNIHNVTTAGNIHNTNNFYGPTLLLQDHEQLKNLDGALEKRGRNLQLEDIVDFLRQYQHISPILQGNIGLILACFRGYLDVFSCLLPSIHVRNGRGETPLILACRKHLLHRAIDGYKGSDFFGFGCILENELCISRVEFSNTNKGVSDIVSELLSRDDDGSAEDNDKFTPLLLSCLFGDLKVVELLLSRGVDVNYTGFLGCTGLVLVCMFDHDKVVDRLLSGGANVNITARGSFSPLFIASVCGHEKIVKKLISHSVNIDELFRNNSPLVHAALYGHLNVVSLLISAGAEIDRRGINDRTPLMTACVSGQSTVAELLISKGANVNHKDTYGMTLLITSAIFGHADTVRMLLSHGADIDMRDVSGRTSLMAACRYGWDDVVKILLYHGADVNITDDHGSTALIHACIKEPKVRLKCTNVLSFFLYVKKLLSMSHGHVLYQVKQNVTGQSIVLGLAKLTNCTDLVSSLQQVFSGDNMDTPTDDTLHYREFEISLPQKTKLKYTVDDSTSALILSFRVGYDSSVRMLLEHNADVSIANKNGDTALSLASGSGQSDIVEMLLKHKADINVKGFNKKKPLIEASRSGHINVVNLLLRHGADINIRNNVGKTALEVAEREGHYKIVCILLKHQTKQKTIMYPQCPKPCQTSKRRIFTKTIKRRKTSLKVAKREGHDKRVCILL